MAVDLKVQGMDQIKRKLDRLSNPKKAKQIARKAGRQAMNIVRDAARSNAKAIDDPETREMIQKNIAVQAGKTTSQNDIKIRVGVRGGAGRNQHSVSTAGLSGGDTRHWRYVEFGTSKMPAIPFMRIAFFNNLDRVANKFVEVFDAEIGKALSEVT